MPEVRNPKLSLAARHLPVYPGARTVALIGQPNCGKSTIFNQVVGYRSETANFPGSTVEVSRGEVRLNGLTLEVFDVPGIYSLTTSNPAEAAAKRFLLSTKVDLIINVVDSALLSRGLELTLELLELGIPMIVCLNMMDDAKRKGISISLEKLAETLNVSVFASIAARGVGVHELFAGVGTPTARPGIGARRWSRDVEEAVASVESTLQIGPETPFMPLRFLAVKLIESDPDVNVLAGQAARMEAQSARRRLQNLRGRSAESIVMAERHDEAMRIFEDVAVVGRPQSDIRFSIDALLTHPFWGYLFLAAIFVGFFWGVFGVGAFVERILQPAFNLASVHISARLGAGTLRGVLIRGIWDGVAGGATIVLPYVVPFLFGLSFLEDLGYLPRVAYLLDGLLHRIGLHGTSVMPLVLGYGCSVPACMATRILPSRRDRFIASVLASLVPCSARSNLIFALVAFYLGPGWALAVFCLNAAIIILSGLILSRIWPEVSPGMLLEVPRYQFPRLKVMTRKVWFRLREFVVLSWPMLIVGSAVLGLAEHWHWDRAINLTLSPLTHLLGLPAVVGTTLIFGILRKELSMIMLVQALGTTQVSSVMTATQILVFTIFVTFYIPCFATIATMVREIGRKMTAIAVGYSLLTATALAATTRMVLSFFLRCFAGD